MSTPVSPGSEPTVCRRLSRNRGKHAAPRRPGSRLISGLVLLLAGGSVFGTCQARFRDAVVSGSKDYFFTFFDPATVVDGILGT